MKRLLALLLIFCLLLAGCGVTEPQGEQTQPSDSQQQSNPTGGDADYKPLVNPFLYQVKKERGFDLDCLDEETEEQQWPYLFLVIRSVEELKDWVTKSLRRDESLPDWIEEYDDAFFETNTLIDVSIFIHIQSETIFKDVIPDEAGRLKITVEVYSIERPPNALVTAASKYSNYLVEVNRVIEDQKLVTLDITKYNLTREEWKEKFGTEYGSNS